MLSGTSGSLARSRQASLPLQLLLHAACSHARPALRGSKCDASAFLPRGGARLLPSGAARAPGGRVVEPAQLGGSPGCRTRDLRRCKGLNIKGDINFNNTNTFNPQYLKHCRFGTNEECKVQHTKYFLPSLGNGCGFKEPGPGPRPRFMWCILALGAQVSQT